MQRPATLFAIPPFPTLVPTLGIAAVTCVLCGCQPDRWHAFEDATAPEHELPQPLPGIEQSTSDSVGQSAAALDIDIPEAGPIELTVEQAALLAIARNRDLHVQRYDPLITATFEEIERGVFDPEVFAQAQQFQQESTEISRATGEEFSTELRETDASAGVRQSFPTGTTVEATVSTDRSASNRAPEQQVARTGLTITQALLRGFGPAVNLASVRQAELDTTASQFHLQGFVESLLAETESTYWLYTLAARRIRIFEESLELARRQRQEVHDRIEIGVLPETERASADAEVAQREQDLIDARASLETLRLELLRLVNPLPGDEMDRELVTISEPTTNPQPLTDIAGRLEVATRHRPDLNEARLRLEQRRLETIVTRNGLLPRLDFFATLGKTGFSNELPDSFERLDGPTYDLAAGLDFSYPLGNRAAEGFHEAAYLSRMQAAEAVQNLTQLIRRDVRIAAVEVERAREQIAASTATRELRQEALRAEEERFRVGDSTSLLVAQAQRDLLESQIAEVDAIVAYRIALIDLYLAEGTLLARRGLLLE